MAARAGRAGLAWPAPLVDRLSWGEGAFSWLPGSSLAESRAGSNRAAFRGLLAVCKNLGRTRPSRRPPRVVPQQSAQALLATTTGPPLGQPQVRVSRAHKPP